ncbi:MAG: precorrin-3B C(17)-methyltransferase [Treponema sp.]|jgi:precorrin-3B C17-methyltransferase|nr:precorrin-3B C(17)-methyltransferase [Treponema sp.]
MNKLYVIGIGPGDSNHLTGEARAALETSELIVGYPLYLGLAADLIRGKRTFSTPMRGELERCRAALEAARSGKTTAVLCSGDAGVYGLAGLVLELAPEYPGVEITVVPGITAALSCAALLGSPLTGDFAVISLSDLLIPWEKIEKRLDAAAASEFVLCLYNPGSVKRSAYLGHACDIVLKYRKGSTVCGMVCHAGRKGEEAVITDLAGLRGAKVDMFTTVFIGSGDTVNIHGKMVTKRGYSPGNGNG